ncbi:MAG: hypothetical protein ACOYMI_05385 [Phycisphaerales bacterium]
MSRDEQRLERLMALLASERTQSRDMRAGVMARLARGGTFIRRARWMRRVALALSLLAGVWLGVDAIRARESRADLGEVGRRGAEWIVPDSQPGRVVPVRHAPAEKRQAREAIAPWGKT